MKKNFLINPSSKELSPKINKLRQKVINNDYLDQAIKKIAADLSLNFNSLNKEK